jgi:hypothetical protein
MLAFKRQASIHYINPTPFPFSNFGAKRFPRSKIGECPLLAQSRRSFVTVPTVGKYTKTI